MIRPGFIPNATLTANVLAQLFFSCLSLFYFFLASFVSINVADTHKRCIGKKKTKDVKNIIIGDKVFIGSHSVILGGAKSGNNSVVSAGTVVRSKNIPPYSLVFGNPYIVKKGYYKNRK